MKCTKCNGESKVIDSRATRYGKYRRRECTLCGHRFSTAEIESDEFRGMENQSNFIKVVRCRECKYRRKTIFTDYCSSAFGLKQITDLNGFCSNGERRAT